VTIPPVGLDEQTSVETLLKLTEGSCDMLPTLKRSPAIETKLMRA
jgi:hypothetical protein